MASPAPTFADVKTLIESRHPSFAPGILAAFPWGSRYEALLCLYFAPVAGLHSLALSGYEKIVRIALADSFSPSFCSDCLLASTKT